MPPTSREIGVLVVVVLKARNLVNKRYFGKQDPYCAITFNGDKRRTKAIKRGGQHPEWDEELRFTIFEEEGDDPSYTAHGSDTPPPPPSKGPGNDMKIKGGTEMRLSCYSDELHKHPKLVGEALVDLTEVLTKGETDRCFPLLKKEKYSGEVYLELTFFANKLAPRKRVEGNTPGTHVRYGAYPHGMYPSVTSPGENTYYSVDEPGESSCAPLINHNEVSPLRLHPSSTICSHAASSVLTSRLDRRTGGIDDFGVFGSYPMPSSHVNTDSQCRIPDPHYIESLQSAARSIFHEDTSSKYPSLYDCISGVVGMSGLDFLHFEDIARGPQYQLTAWTSSVIVSGERWATATAHKRETAEHEAAQTFLQLVYEESTGLKERLKQLATRNTTDSLSADGTASSSQTINVVHHQREGKSFETGRKRNENMVATGVARTRAWQPSIGACRDSSEKELLEQISAYLYLDVASRYLRSIPIYPALVAAAFSHASLCLTDRRVLARLQRTLDETIHQNEDKPLSWLICHKDVEAKLQRIVGTKPDKDGCKHVPLYKLPDHLVTIRDSQDVRSLACYFASILENHTLAREIYHQKGQDVQILLDLLQTTITRSNVGSNIQRMLRYTVIKLAGKSGRYPQCLKLHGVTWETEPFGRGGFGDIDLGKMETKPNVKLAIKVIRVYQKSDFEKLMK